MKKVPWIRIAVTILIWLCLTLYKKYYMIFDTNEAAIAQLNSSDSDYANWQSWRDLVRYYWILYVLPLLMFIPYAFKNKNSSEEN